MRLFDETRSDARFALRAFRRSPGFTATALATLIVGIAAATSIFSYMNAVYFAAFPYKDAGRIVALSQRVMNGNGNGSFSAVSLDAIRAMREPTRSFERVSAYRELGATIMVGSEPRRLTVLAVDSSFVPLFGLHPELGQLLSADEIVRRAPVAMISRELWRAQYGSDPGVRHRHHADARRAHGHRGGRAAARLQLPISHRRDRSAPRGRRLRGPRSPTPRLRSWRSCARASRGAPRAPRSA